MPTPLSVTPLRRLATAAAVASVVLCFTSSDAFAEPPGAQSFLYEYLGTPLSGSFPGGTFTNATIRLRATGDSTNVLSSTIPGLPGNFITVIPTVEVIDTGTTTFSGTLLAGPQEEWRVISTTSFGSASGFIRFNTSTNNFDRSLVALGGPLLDLISDTTISGPLQGGGGTLGTLTTSGTIFIDPASASTATFSVTGVPEIDPSGVGSVLALIGGALGLRERRRTPVRRQEPMRSGAI